MNENPNGTPNPLSQSPNMEPQMNNNFLDANPAEPMMPVGQSRVVDPMIAGRQPRMSRSKNGRPSLDGMSSAMPSRSTLNGSIQSPTNGSFMSNDGPRTPFMNNTGNMNNMGNATMGSNSENPDRLTMAVEQVTMGDTATSNDPTMRPMERAPVVPTAPPKKKKTGLIIAIVAAVVLLIGGGVLAVVLLTLNREDVVATAASKLFNSEIPENASVNGTINISSNDPRAVVSNVSFGLDIDAVTSSMINSATIEMTAHFSNDTESTIVFNEVYAANGDLYLKFSGAPQMITDYDAALQNAALTNRVPANTTTEVKDCDIDEQVKDTCSDNPNTTEVSECAPGTDCTAPQLENEVQPNDVSSDDALSLILQSFAGLFELVDGQWLRIPIESINQVSDATTSGAGLSCLTEFVGNIKNYSNNLAKTYNDNPFIGSTTEGVTINSLQYPVRKIVLDSEKYVGFMNGFQNSTLVRNLTNCLNLGNSPISSTDALTKAEELPDIYVEVDDNRNFTRLYIQDDLEAVCPNGMNCSNSDTSTMTIDLSFSYPVNVNVAEPKDARDFNEIIQQLIQLMGPVETVEPVEAAEVVEPSE